MGQVVHGSATATEIVCQATRYAFNRKIVTRLPLLLICLVLLLSFAPTLAVPPNFANDTLILNLNFPTSMAFLPDGRMLITELGGVIRHLPAVANLHSDTFVDANHDRIVESNAEHYADTHQHCRANAGHIPSSLADGNANTAPLTTAL